MTQAPAESDQWANVVEAARAEFTALRDELKTHQQASHSVIAVGLTAAAAIAGFSVGREDSDRLELLLVLPIVLTGLGSFYLEKSRASYVVGTYLNDYVWPRMHGPARIPTVSWESYIADNRGNALGVLSGILPGVLIFFAPSVAALYVNAGTFWLGFLPGKARTTLPDGLDTLYYVDYVAVALLIVLVPAVFLGRPTPQKGGKPDAFIASRVTEQ